MWPYCRWFKKIPESGESGTRCSGSVQCGPTRTEPGAEPPWTSPGSAGRGQKVWCGPCTLHCFGRRKVGASVQSLWSLWPTLALFGDMLFSRSSWMLRHCLLRVIFSLFWNNWSTRVGASVIIVHHVIPLAMSPVCDECVVNISVMQRLKCWPSFSSIECSLYSILETKMLKSFLSKAQFAMLCCQIATCTQKQVGFWRSAGGIVDFYHIA